MENSNRTILVTGATGNQGGVDRASSAPTWQIQGAGNGARRK